MNEMLEALSNILYQYELKINVMKIECMLISKTGEPAANIFMLAEDK